MLLSLVLNLLASFALFLTLAAFGARLRRLARVPLTPGLKLCGDVALGSGGVALLVVVLGLLQVWRPLVIAGLEVFLVLAGRWQLRQWLFRPLVWPGLAALLLLPLALAPPFFYDALVYHLSLPWQWYLEGGIGPHRETIYASLPPLYSCLAAFLVPWGLDRAPALLHLLAFVVAAAGLFSIGRSLGASKTLAAVCSFCLLLVPLYVLVPGLPAAEGFAVVASVVTLGIALHRRSIPGALGLAGLLLGTALAVKLQTAPMILLLGLGLLWRTKPRPGQMLTAGLGFLLAAAPWWAKNWLLLGQPFMPFGWRGPGLEAAFRDSVITLHTATTFRDLFRPLAADLWPHASYLLPAILAGLLGGLRGGNWPWRMLGLVLVGGVLAWDFTAALPRFLAPWAPVLLLWPITAAKRTAGRWAAALAVGVTAALGLVATLGQMHRFACFSLPFEPVSGAYQRLVVNNPFPVFAVAKTLLPPKAKVLFVGEPRGFGFPRRFSAPSYLDEPKLASVLEASQDLSRVMAWLDKEGFTHLLVNWGELERLAPGYPTEPWRTPAGRDQFLRLIRQLDPPLVQMGGVCLYSLGKSRV
ncbi:MAG: hypothetical protein ACUVRY_01035 [Thermoanaerobaculaceae bacterium]